MFFRSVLIPGTLITLALLAVLAADVLTPLGLAVWMFYLLPVCLCLFVDKPQLPLIAGGAAILFVGIGFFFSQGGVNPALAIRNRAICAVVLAFLAITIYRYIVARLALAREAWLQDINVQVAQQVRSLQGASAMGEAMLRTLSRAVDARVGVVYRLEDDRLVRTASWALSDGHAVPETLRMGQTLAGQVAAENRILVADHLPADYLPVASALGSTRSAVVIAAPLTAEGEVVGVIELGFIDAGRNIADLREALARTAESVGMMLRASLYRTRLESLLHETQRQSEELQVQQEELRVSNEELEERGRALMESQARLETQQAELEQTNVQLEEHTFRLEGQKQDLLTFQAELAENARTLARSNQYKSEFLANMSHELRTPLNSALILAKLLRDNREGTLTSEQVGYAATIHSANKDLLNLINDILDLSKIEAGHLVVEPENVRVDGIFASVRQTFDPVAGQKGLAFHVERMPGVPDEIFTDDLRLQQVLKNLLSNAFKFTDRGAVTLTVATQDDDTVRFEVRDTGIGIAPDKQQAIFEAFQQGDGTTSRRYGGTGLGLSISRELARLLGGSIAVASQPGEGSVFSLTVPRKLVAEPQPGMTEGPGAMSADSGMPVRDSGNWLPRSAPAAPARYNNFHGHPAVPAGALAPVPPPVPHSEAATAFAGFPAPIPDDRDRRSRGNRLILVVEDDLAFANILYTLAHELDFDCIHATTCQQGLELAREHQPCGILLDVGLPDQSGLTLLNWLKRDPGTRHIPTHLISVSDHAEAALHQGAIGYTLKPSERSKLVDVVRGLESHLTQRERRVLVVEDDPVLRKSIRALLQSLDVEIQTAESIAEATRLLAEYRFDCIVMDMVLPDGSGHDLLERMAADESRPMAPVIVYTGRHLSAEDEQRLRRHSKSIIIKGARSPDRLLDEVTLFLHSVESSLPPEQQRMLRAARSRDEAFDGRKILLVEDDARNIFALSKVMEPLGATVEIARNGREALEMLALHDDIELVLMDIMMPEMDGLTAMREIRAKPHLERLPVIALTAKAMSSDRDACLRAGASDYIAKPIDIDKLLSLCRVWLHAR